jgi:hypothetical protein
MFLKTEINFCRIHQHTFWIMVITNNLSISKLIGLLNICGAIDNINIPLAKRPSRTYILQCWIITIEKKIITLPYKLYVMWRKLSKKIVLGSLKEFMTRINSRGLVCTWNWGFTNFVKTWNDYSKHEDDPLFHCWFCLLHIYLFAKNKRRYDNNMNFERIITENVFGSLKNQWKILKIFKSSVDRAFTIAIACCMYCTIIERCKFFHNQAM